MTRRTISDEDFISAWRQGRCSPTEVSKLIGMNVRAVYSRRNSLALKGIDLPSIPLSRSGSDVGAWTYPRQLNMDIDTGVAIIGSDAHIWPGDRTTAMKAMMLVTEAFGQSVRLLSANGDWLDGARTNRHDPHGWNERPSVKEELQCVQEAMHDWSTAAKIARTKARRIYQIGNHELNFERHLAVKAKDFQGMLGMRLQDHFPDWELCWSLFVNRKSSAPVMIKHRHANGVHAAYNNTLKGGVSMVTGHTHILEVKPWGDYRGRRWGVQTGALADLSGAQFEYGENSPSPSCGGFAVLTFKDGRLMPPEICEVIEGRAIFRGEVVVDDHDRWAAE